MPEMPTWDEFMVPVLRVMTDGQLRGIRVIRTRTADEVGLSEAQLAEGLPSGQAKAENRLGGPFRTSLGWARPCDLSAVSIK